MICQLRGVIMKVKCSECTVEKEFNKYEVKRGRFENWKCKSCAIRLSWDKRGRKTKEEKVDLQKKYYQENREKLDAYNTNWIANRRLELIDEFGGIKIGTIKIGTIKYLLYLYEK